MIGEKMKHICFVCDDNFARYTYVAIRSIQINNVSRESYHFHVLTDKGLTGANRDLLNSLSLQCVPRGEVTIHCVEEDYSDACLLKDTHVSKATYYKLNIANHLKDVSICLYLDADLVVDKDISGVFEFDLNNKYILGVKQIGNRLNRQTEIWFREEWGLPSIDEYVNTGVLLMNLDKMRSDCIVEKFMSIINNSPEAEQFVINKVCYGKIGFLPYKYNVAGRMIHRVDILKKIFPDEEIYAAISNPVIIHYADKKPWQYLNLPFADRWWDYASRTPLYNDFLRDYMTFRFKPSFSRYMAGDNMDELLTFLKGKRVVIYGAGDYGIRFYRLMISRAIYPFCFVVSDNMKHPDSVDGFAVREFSDVLEYADRCVYVVAMSDAYQRDVISKLETCSAAYYCINEEWLSNYEEVSERRKKDITIISKQEEGDE